MAFTVKTGLSEMATGAGMMEMGVLLAVNQSYLLLAGWLPPEPLNLRPFTTVAWHSTDRKPERWVGTHSTEHSECPMERSTDLIL